MAPRRSDAGVDDVDPDWRKEESARARAFTAMVEDRGAGNCAASNFRETRFWNRDWSESLSRRQIQRRLSEFPRRPEVAPGFIAERKNRIRCRRCGFQNGRLQ